MMRMFSTGQGRAVRCALLALCVPFMLMSGCGGTTQNSGNYSYNWITRREPQAQTSSGRLRPFWTKQLVPRGASRMQPVEYASAGLDEKRERMYVGSGRGYLYALDYRSREVFTYNAESSIESQPVIDAKTGAVYFGSIDGTVHALSRDGKLRWKAMLEGPFRQKPILQGGVLYMVSDADSVWAVDTSNGNVLWTYRGEQIEEMSIAGHAGLLLDNGRLYTGLTNGKIVALDATSGGLVWEIDTSRDISEEISGAFYDVDTTPVIIGQELLIASFQAGLYALELESGSVIRRNAEMTGITALARWRNKLLVGTSEQGLSLFDPETSKLRVIDEGLRGSPAKFAMARGDAVLVADSRGALRLVAIATGAELDRVENEYGFSAPPTAGRDLAVQLSNGGRLLVCELN